MLFNIQPGIPSGRLTLIIKHSEDDYSIPYLHLVKDYILSNTLTKNTFTRYKLKTISDHFIINEDTVFLTREELLILESQYF
jgi:hypothetical protein